jgi:hypothetical protein
MNRDCKLETKGSSPARGEVPGRRPVVATVGVAIPRTSHSGFNEGSPRSMPVGSVHHRHPPAAGTSPAKQWNTTTIHSSAITRGRTIQRRIRTHTPLGGSRDHQTLGTQPNPNSLRGQSTISPRPTRAPQKNRRPGRKKKSLPSSSTAIRTTPP